MNRSAIISIPGNREKDSSVQVLRVHKGRFHTNQEDEHLPNGIYVCHAPLSQTLNEQMWINNKHIDAVIVGPDCSIEDIIAIREIASHEVVPLIFHTLKYDWRAREISLESGVDEYHIGFLDQRFIKRITMIKRVKLFSKANQIKKVKRLFLKNISVHGFLKRSFDLVIAALIILSLLPILLVIVPLLLLETNGSILIRSKRVGKNYQVFNLYEFARISSRGNKKINLIRNFLRKAHLVGLPQLLNVLAGEMSLVGNYPIHEQDAEKFTNDGIALRFLAPVGIVGLWRFNSVEQNKINEWKTDVEYAKANSIWLDMKIILIHFMNMLDGQHSRDKELMMPVLNREHVQAAL